MNEIVPEMGCFALADDEPVLGAVRLRLVAVVTPAGSEQAAIQVTPMTSQNRFCICELRLDGATIAPDCERDMVRMH